MKLPETNSCCFYCPLRWGIILFGYINMIFSLLAAFTLAVSIEMRDRSVWTTVEVTGAFLFAIFGMSVILSILLLYATYEKDKVMLRLYISYMTATAIAAIVPTALLLYLQQFIAAAVAFGTIVLQCYVIILVRSEIIILKKATRRVERPPPEDEIVEVPDTEVLV